MTTDAKFTCLYIHRRANIEPILHATATLTPLEVQLKTCQPHTLIAALSSSASGDRLSDHVNVMCSFVQRKINSPQMR